MEWIYLLVGVVVGWVLTAIYVLVKLVPLIKARNKRRKEYEEYLRGPVDPRD